MWFFKKKAIDPVDLSWLGTDMHSHLLPGIDDGSQNIETSLELIKALAALGYKKLITTPHILWEVYPNTTEIIIQKLAELKEAVAEAGIDIELGAAAEYFIDEYFVDLLDKKVPLLPISGNNVLVEFSMITAPFELQQILFDMQMAGYQPIIAHPERYIYLSRKREFFDLLKDAGCFFQLNLLSITGHYGVTVGELAEYLLEKGYYNFCGTDLHHTKHIGLLNKLSTSPLYKDLKEMDWKNASL